MNLKDLVKHIDYTTLNAVDTNASVEIFVGKALSLESKGLAVAGICTFSNFAELLVGNLQNSSIKAVVVAGAFPHSQAPIEVKMLEVELASKQNVDEIDVVISRNLLLANNFDEAKKELILLKAKSGKSKLKVILETCEIESEELLKKSCEIAMDSGADFIKTSTGKGGKGASLDSFEIMCVEIKKYHQKTNLKVGIKAAGGIRDFETAFAYYNVVENVLGKEWLRPEYFRIGASSLLNELE